jgi:hypothetical protein
MLIKGTDAHRKYVNIYRIFKNVHAIWTIEKYKGEIIHSIEV